MANCREHCRQAQLCRLKGWDDLDPDNCAMFYKIEDLLWDAECEAMAERAREREEMELNDPDDWYDM